MASGYRYAGAQRPARSAWLGKALGLLSAFLLGFVVSAALAPGGGGSARAPAHSALGPRAVKDGVPVGYAHSPEGAAEAIGRYSQAFADPAILRPGGLNRRLAVAVTPDYLQTMKRINAPGTARLASGPLGQGLRHGLETIYSGFPLGYRVESYTPQRARILNWGFTLIGNASSAQPQAYFGVSHTDLVWQAGDWKIARSEAGFGPTPKLVTPAGPTGGYDVLRLAKTLRSYAITP